MKDIHMLGGGGVSQKCTFVDKGEGGVSELCTYTFSRQTLLNMDMFCFRMHSKNLHIFWKKIKKIQKCTYLLRGFVYCVFTFVDKGGRG